MMQLPLLPTDSLYKFFTLGGLAIMLVAPLYAERQSHEARLAAVDFQIDLARHRGTLGVYRYYRQTEEIDGVVHLARLDSLVVQGIMQGATHDAESERVKLLVDRARFWRAVAVWAFAVGGSLTTAGYLLWYFLLQRPQDQILARTRQQMLEHEEG